VCITERHGPIASTYFALKYNSKFYMAASMSSSINLNLLRTTRDNQHHLYIQCFMPGFWNWEDKPQNSMSEIKRFPWFIQRLMQSCLHESSSCPALYNLLHELMILQHIMQPSTAQASEQRDDPQSSQQTTAPISHAVMQLQLTSHPATGSRLSWPKYTVY